MESHLEPTEDSFDIVSPVVTKEEGEIEIAIGDENPPPAKRQRSEETTNVESKPKSEAAQVTEDSKNSELLEKVNYDNLLVECEPPNRPEERQSDNMSPIHGETPVESSDENDQSCINEENTESDQDTTKLVVPLKLHFMRKFARAHGKLSRPEMEQMLVQKISESLMFCSENSELHARLEKQEKLCETIKNLLNNVVKQYNDLQRIQERVNQDLKKRPKAPIFPLKLMRSVGLQVDLEVGTRVKRGGKTTGISEIIDLTNDDEDNSASVTEN